MKSNVLCSFSRWASERDGNASRTRKKINHQFSWFRSDRVLRPLVIDSSRFTQVSMLVLLLLLLLLPIARSSAVYYYYYSLLFEDSRFLYVHQYFIGFFFLRLEYSVFISHFAAEAIVRL